jgi:hypothetical protein
MGDEVDSYFFVVRGRFFLILLDTAFDDHIHIILNITLFIYLYSFFNGNKLAMFIDLKSFFCSIIE